MAYLKSLVVMTVFGGLMGVAAAQSCDDIKDKDKANYCRAINANDGAFCKKIGNGDMQNLCTAKIENDPKYCKRINTEKFKKRCENSIRK